jgi:hypothetical protein
MPTKKETTTSTAKKTTTKKAVAEGNAAEATASRQAKATKKAPAQKPTVTAAPASPVAAIAASTEQAPKAPAAKPAAEATRIMAHVDVGPGNTLYIRGEGGGLNWDKGVPMACIGGDCWSWSVKSAAQHITFKVLINDHQWSAGDNLTVAHGHTATFMPSF